MLQRKPKTAAGTRAMKKKESVAEEGAKTAIFLKGTNTSQVVTDCLKDLHALKKPDAKMFSKKNDINPFEDAKQFEFLSLKNDASLFMFANHSKKRMHNLTLTRMFDHSLLDMVELGIQRYTKMSDFKAPKISLGFRPLICFRGEHWDSSDELRTIRSILLDFYTGDTSADMIDLSHGITHSMVFTLIGTPDSPCRILLNVYNIKLLKNEEDEKKPKVELEECGPFVEFIQRRCTLANPDMIKEAMRLPKMNQPKKQKNIEKNEFGERVGRVWMEKQDLGKLQTRKMKGLKRKADQIAGEDKGEDVEELVGSQLYQRKGNTRETVLNAPLYIENLKHSSKREEFAYPFWWGHEENKNADLVKKKMMPKLQLSEAQILTRPAAGIVRPKSPVYTVVSYPCILVLKLVPKKMVDEMTQTDFVRSRANSITRVDPARGKSPVKNNAEASIKHSLTHEPASVTIKSKILDKDLIPQHEMLSPLVFQMPQRVAKSPEQFFIGFDQKPPQKLPLKFAPRTSTPKSNIPIKKKDLESERPKTSPTKPQSKLKMFAKSPIKGKAKTPLKTKLKKEVTPLRPNTSNIVRTPAQSLPSPSRSSPFPESIPPPADGIYAIAINFLNGPTIRCLEHDIADMTMNTFRTSIMDSFWDKNDGLESL